MPLDLAEDPGRDRDASFSAYRDLHAAAWGARAPAPGDGRVAAWDAHLHQALDTGYRQLRQGLEGRGASFLGLVELSMRHHLPQVTRFFLRFFQLTRRFPQVPFDPEIHFCETLPEFINARLEGYHLSPELKAAELARLGAEAEAEARDQNRGTFGVYLSGQGCYLNGWLFNYGRAGHARELLRASAPEMPRLLSTAIHELLGHGFLAEYSALGVEKKAIGVQDWDYARRFQFRGVDQAAQTLLLRKLSLAQYGSRLLEEGWSAWIASLLTPALLGQPRQPGYTLAGLWAAVERFPLQATDQAAFRHILQTLFLEPARDPEALLPAIRVLQSVGLDWAFAAGLGQPPAYVVGSLLMDQLEARVGLLNVPHALLIAANVTYDLLNIGWSDMFALFQSRARFNPDWRLAALSTLALEPAGPPAAPISLAALAHLAQSQLNLAVPAAYADR